MKHSVKHLEGYKLGASDGEIGEVKDLYFDDNTWTVRYLVVETGGWFSGRKVLISPAAIMQGNWEDKIIPVNLTREQVKNSPDIDTEKPVDRQQEILLYQHYGVGDYWSAGGLWAGGLGTTGMMMQPTLPLEESIHEERENELQSKNDTNDNPHLRSTDNVKGYTIKATDGRIGDVEDFIIDDSNWKIRFIIVDTGNWLPGKKVIISPNWIKEVKWETSSVIVDVTVDRVKNSPEYDPDKPLSDEYETGLNKHYNKIISIA
jgi:uncharacterized protein YrrD